MARDTSQRLKLFYLRKILLDKTDDDHGLTISEIVDELKRYGITSERKSLYADLSALDQMDFEVENVRVGNRYEYRVIAGRKYQLAEVKLMVDAIQSTRFITKKKSNELIKKLEKEVSIYEAKKLQRTVFIEKRSKTDNESIYISIDQIYRAIQDEKQICFNYYQWFVEFNGYKKVIEKPKYDGKLYTVSPWCMLWNDEKYYLVAYDADAKKIKHYRVDKIKNAVVLPQERLGSEAFKDFDVSTYTKKTFGMFGGDAPKEVTLKIDNSLIGVIIDRFGSDYHITKADDTHSNITVSVYTSQQFFGWIFGLGDLVEIVSPKAVVKEFKATIRKINKLYRK